MPTHHPSFLITTESRPRPVQISVEFKRIGEIDTMNEKYQAEIVIESSWTETEEINSYDPKIHWNPFLYVDNLISESRQHIYYNIEVDESSHTRTITEVRNLKGTFWERLELQNFPLDVQELSVIITSKLSEDKVILVSDDRKVSRVDLEASKTFIDQQKWTLYKLVHISKHASYDLTSSTLSLNLTQNPLSLLRPTKICVTIFASRKPGYYFSNAFFLIFLITISSLNTFSIDCKLPQNRLQSTFTLLLTSISFKWVINRSLPSVAYLNSLDQYAIACIFYLCMLCLSHAIIGAYSYLGISKEVDKWLLVGFAIYFVLMHFYFIIWLIRAYHKIHMLKKEEREFIEKLQKIPPTISRSVTNVRL